MKSVKGIISWLLGIVFVSLYILLIDIVLVILGLFAQKDALIIARGIAKFLADYSEERAEGETK